MLEEVKGAIAAQKNEITEHYIYRKLIQSVKDSNNMIVLRHILIGKLHHR